MGGTFSVLLEVQQEGAKAHQGRRLDRTTNKCDRGSNAYEFPNLRPISVVVFANAKIIFARDLQDRLGILALLALSASLRICKSQIPLARRETDPVSGHHLESIT